MLNNDLTKNTIENNGTNKALQIGNNQGNLNVLVIQDGTSEHKNNISCLAELINAIGDCCGEVNFDDSSFNINAFNIDEKIKYNNIQIYRDLINDYSRIYFYCNELMNKKDNIKPGIKNKILIYINLKYKEILRDLCKKYTEKSKMDVIQLHADEIIDGLKEKINSTIKNSTNNICVENIDIGTDFFIVYCFMECKILEKPK